MKKIQKNSNSDKHAIMYICKIYYMFWSVFFMNVVICFGFEVYDKHYGNYWFCFLLSMLCIIALIGMRRVYLKIENGTLSYRFIYGDEKNINICDIESAWIDVDWNPKHEFVRLMIVPKKNVPKDSFSVNPSLFDANERLEFFKLLPMKEKESSTAIEEWLRKSILKAKSKE